MKASNCFVAISCIVVLLSAPQVAFSEIGVVISSEQIPAKSRAGLLSAIEIAKSKDPESFRRLREMVERYPEISAGARIQTPPFGIYLRGVGPEGFYPILEMLVVDSPSLSGMTRAQQVSIKIGLISWLGSLRDVRALPYLEAMFNHTDSDESAMFALARAIGLDESDQALSYLISGLDSKSRSRRLAILHGLGSCRRAGSAEKLAELLSLHPDAETAKTIVDSLGSAADGLIWISAAKHTEEKEAVRQHAIYAVIQAFVHYDSEMVRESARKALLRILHPSTESIIEEEIQDAKSNELVIRDLMDLSEYYRRYKSKIGKSLLDRI
jgi:hypothetical protein